jgi:rhamnosyl/mannosyltransferase
VAEKLVTGLSSRGFKVDLLSSADIPRKEWREVRLSSMLFHLKSLQKKLQDYDIIHLHGPVPTFSDVFLLDRIRSLSNAKRPKLVFTYHAPIEFQSLAARPFAWSYNLSQEMMASIADHVVVTTQSYSNRLSRFVNSNKLSVVPWGVDFTRFQAPVTKEGPFTVVYLGQIRPYKGLPVLLDAARGLSNVQIWVIGSGHFEKECKAQARRNGLKNVTFWGKVDDQQVVKLLKKAHAIVLPSVTRSEAFGIALLEGMAAGMVPVASYLPGVADLIGNEGITYPAGNPDALHSVLARLRDDPYLRTQLATVAQSKAQLYSWERSIFGYERVFSSLLGGPSTEEQPILLPVNHALVKETVYYE